MGRQFTWNFIRENYDIFNVDGPNCSGFLIFFITSFSVTKWMVSFFSFQFVLRSVVRNFQTESKLNEVNECPFFSFFSFSSPDKRIKVQQFFEKNPPVVGELVSRSATEAIQVFFLSLLLFPFSFFEKQICRQIFFGEHKISQSYVTISLMALMQFKSLFFEA